MKTKQTIAIIDATGSMGSAIANSLSRHNYPLVLMSKDYEKLNALRKSLSGTDTKAVINLGDCAKDASWEADVIILACPYEAEREIAEKTREVATGKIVISISNPLNENHNALVTPPDTSAAEELQKLLPHSKVVKAWNTTFPADFASPVNGQRPDSFIASNNSYALDVVSEIVAATGFNPAVVGDLSVSRTLENMQLMLIQVAARNNYNWYAGWKILHG